MRRWHIPSVTFSFSLGSVGFPFADGMLTFFHFLFQDLIILS